MTTSRTTAAPLLGLAAAAVLFVAPQAARAQGLILNSGDALTVSGAGTVGIVGGQTGSNNTTAYSSSITSGVVVRTNGTAAFTLGTGGTLTNTGTSGDGLDAFGSGPVTVTGGSITIGTGGVGLGTSNTSTGPVTVSGGIFTVGQLSTGLFASGSGSVTVTGGTFTVATGSNALFAGGGTINLFGSFDGYNAGMTTLTGTGSFTGTLTNNTASQTFTYSTSSSAGGSIILNNTAPGAAPEPSQYAAFGVGLLGLGALAIKARRRTA